MIAKINLNIQLNELPSENIYDISNNIAKEYLMVWKEI